MTPPGLRLFQRTPGLKLHSGDVTNFKIDCDALSLSDWDDLARLASSLTQFGRVIGIETGGVRFARAMQQYAQPECSRLLIVDDVMTTGASFEEVKARTEGPHAGIVLFGRGNSSSWPSWVKPLLITTGHMETAMSKR